VAIGDTRRALQAAQVALTAGGIAVLGYCALAWADAERFQTVTARQFAAQYLGGPGSSTLHAPRMLPVDGEPMARLEIPRLGVSVVVVEGVAGGDLRRAIGHIPGTAFPWQSGNVGIAGHRDTFFRCLRSIRRNDVITLTTLEKVYRYRVISTDVVHPCDVEVLAPGGNDSLTLVTCFPFYFVGSAPQRFIVRANRG